jgi:hypothetical protein
MMHCGKFTVLISSDNAIFYLTKYKFLLPILIPLLLYHAGKVASSPNG